MYERPMSNLSKVLIVLITIIVLLFARSLISDRAIYQGEIEIPLQTDLSDMKEIRHIGKEGEVILLPKAEYTLKGVVKSKKKYSDYSSQISDYDLTFAWGELNKDGVDDFIKYSQSGRWYYYKYESGTPVSGDYIAKHSANVHIIHNNKEILEKIKRIDPGDFVVLKGYLVDVDFNKNDNDALWRTSTTRDDTGNGACEILFVEEVEIVD
ncbi:MAG: hypothetical protein K8R73_15515 [Clostridiales bacterium]|nr:hypothetical protein [Clostridiales bacterium]